MPVTHRRADPEGLAWAHREASSANPIARRFPEGLLHFVSARTDVLDHEFALRTEVEDITSHVNRVIEFDPNINFGTDEVLNKLVKILGKRKNHLPKPTVKFR